MNIVLAIFRAATDGEPSAQTPYFCELSINYNDAVIVTNGLIYRKNGKWDLKSFDIDSIANSDSYDLCKTQGNKQGFEFSSDKDKMDDAREQDLADALELVANNLWLYTVTIEYPNKTKGCKL